MGFPLKNCLGRVVGGVFACFGLVGSLKNGPPVVELPRARALGVTNIYIYIYICICRMFRRMSNCMGGEDAKDKAQEKQKTLKVANTAVDYLKDPTRQFDTVLENAKKAGAVVSGDFNDTSGMLIRARAMEMLEKAVTCLSTGGKVDFTIQDVRSVVNDLTVKIRTISHVRHGARRTPSPMLSSKAVR
jgi:hypothetical protein